jgi:hypothetical protein
MYRFIVYGKGEAAVEEGAVVVQNALQSLLQAAKGCENKPGEHHSDKCSS